MDKKVSQKYKDRFLCPCCFMPTLQDRGCYGICPICFWEDEGMDTENETEISNANNSYTLKEARENFVKHFTMYRESDKEAFEKEKRKEPKRKKIYDAFAQAMESQKEDDWKKALEVEEDCIS